MGNYKGTILHPTHYLVAHCVRASRYKRLSLIGHWLDIQYTVISITWGGGGGGGGGGCPSIPPE